MKCATPLVLATLSGTGPSPHPAGVTAPFAHTPSPPPASGKALWGTELANNVYSDNFTVSWDSGDGNQDVAQRVVDVLEKAWSGLVVTQGWAAPTSAEEYLLRVVLDPSINHTGYTTLYFEDEFPQGVPVIFLNPDYASEGAFWEHLAVHEFGHMLQYRVRDYSGSSGEAWYWEASAEWAAELAVPDLDVYAIQTWHYAQNPGGRFDLIDGGHEYGMLTVNAWLEEHVLGEGGLLSVWQAGEDLAGEDWTVILEGVSGLSVGEIWAGFTTALAHGDLREGSLYDVPEGKGFVSSNSNGLLALLGSDYWQVEEDALVTVTGEAILGSVVDRGESALAQAGEWITVTALVQDASYSLSLDGVPETRDTGDSGGIDSRPEAGLTDDKGIACGCRSAPSKLGPWMLLGGLGLWIRRRPGVADP